MAATNQLNYMDVQSSEDVGTFINMYRGSGITILLRRQFDEACKNNIDEAFSGLGNFLEYVIEHHQQTHSRSELTDHFIYTEIRDLVANLIKNPDFSEYKDYLSAKIDELSNSINSKL